LLIDLLLAPSSDFDSKTNFQSHSSSVAAVLKWADENGLGNTVRALLEEPVLKANTSTNPLEFVIGWVSERGYTFLVQLLLSDRRIDPSARQQYALRLASQNGHVEVVKLLLADSRVDPSVDDQYPIRVACQGGHADVVAVLLTDKRVTPSVQSLDLLATACENGHVEVVKLLLADKRANPAEKDQAAIRAAAHLGHTEIVKLLLADERVDPSSEDQYSIRWACENGHSAVVQLLLADRRVDPSAKDQIEYAIRWACENNHLEVVKLLLADPRVDPSAKDQFSLHIARYSGYTEVVKVLLSDQRVDLTDSPAPHLPSMLALFLLRPSFRRSFLLDTRRHQDTHSQSDFRSVVSTIAQIEKQRQALLDAHLLVSDLSLLCLSYVPDLFCHLVDDIDLSTLPVVESNSEFPQFSVSCLSTL
jgi:ankyrin repeat protein